VKHGSPYNSPEARSILDAIRRIVQALRLSDRAAERQAGISGAQLFVLEKLAAAQGPLSVNELADATLTHQSSVSVVVQKLEQRGLVTRVRNTRDARRVELSLTPQARKLLRKAPQATQDKIISAINAMPPSQRKQLAKLLESLSQSLGGDAAPSMLFEDADDKSAVKSGARRRGRPRCVDR